MGFLDSMINNEKPAVCGICRRPCRSGKVVNYRIICEDCQEEFKGK